MRFRDQLLRARRRVTLAVATLLFITLPAAVARADCYTDTMAFLSSNCWNQVVVGGTINSITDALTEATSWVASTAIEAINAQDTIDLNQNWFNQSLSTSTRVGAAMALIALLLSVTVAALKRDGKEIARSVAQVIVAGITTGALAALTDFGMSAVNGLCGVVTGLNPDGTPAPMGCQMRGYIGFLNWSAAHKVGSGWKADDCAAFSNSDYGKGLELPSIIAWIFLGLALLVLIIIWGEMVVRHIILDLCLIFWPLAVSGSVWTRAKLWQHRLLDTILTAALSKLFIVILLNAATGVMANAKDVNDIIIGLAFLALAAASPFVTMQLAGFVGGALNPASSQSDFSRTGRAQGTAIASTAASAGTRLAAGGALAAASGAASAAGWGRDALAGAAARLGMRSGGRGEEDRGDGAQSAAQNRANTALPSGSRPSLAGGSRGPDPQGLPAGPSTPALPGPRLALPSSSGDSGSSPTGSPPRPSTPTGPNTGSSTGSPPSSGSTTGSPFTPGNGTPAGIPAPTSNTQRTIPGEVLSSMPDNQNPAGTPSSTPRPGQQPPAAGTSARSWMQDQMHQALGPPPNAPAVATPTPPLPRPTTSTAPGAPGFQPPAPVPSAAPGPPSPPPNTTPPSSPLQPPPVPGGPAVPPPAAYPPAGAPAPPAPTAPAPGALPPIAPPAAPVPQPAPPTRQAPPPMTPAPAMPPPIPPGPVPGAVPQPVPGSPPRMNIPTPGTLPPLPPSAFPGIDSLPPPPTQPFSPATDQQRQGARDAIELQQRESDVDEG